MFKRVNHRDVSQDASYVWVFDNPDPVVTFYANEKPDTKSYKKMALLGFAYPYLVSL